MTITARQWDKYVTSLSRINKKAAELMQTYVDSKGLEDVKGVIDYAYALTTKYGTAASELACEMYDECVLLSDLNDKLDKIKAAEPAETATYAETAKAVNGSLKQSPMGNLVASTVERLVKQAGADTTLKNALRDGAFFAWIPHGDTCAFCLTLASRGWQRASKRIVKGGHAEHIHANCDCTFAVKFDPFDEVEGYEPDHYKQLYDLAEGENSDEKIKSLRRILDKVEIGNDINISENKAEIKNAIWLSETFGGKVKLLPRDMTKMTPDYEWNGKLWDLKTPVSNTGNSIDKLVHHGMKQIQENAGGIMLNLENNDLDFDTAMNIASRRIQREKSSHSLGDIKLIVKNKDLYKVKDI